MQFQKSLQTPGEKNQRGHVANDTSTASAEKHSETQRKLFRGPIHGPTEKHYVNAEPGHDVWFSDLILNEKSPWLDLPKSHQGQETYQRMIYNLSEVEEDPLGARKVLCRLLFSVSRKDFHPERQKF